MCKRIAAVVATQYTKLLQLQLFTLQRQLFTITFNVSQMLTLTKLNDIFRRCFNNNYYLLFFCPMRSAEVAVGKQLLLLLFDYPTKP